MGEMTEQKMAIWKAANTANEKFGRMPSRWVEFFIDALLAAAPHADTAGAVQDTYFVDTQIPINAMSADIESDRVLKLWFRRPVTDKDRLDLTDALNLFIKEKGTPPAAPAHKGTFPSSTKIDYRKFYAWAGLNGQRPSNAELAFYLEIELGNREEVDSLEMAVWLEAIEVLKQWPDTPPQQAGLREQTIEECAKIADQSLPRDGHHLDMARRIADKIRALAAPASDEVKK